MNPNIRLLTLKIRPELMRDSLLFYSALGFEFKQEVHGNGPIHYSSESNGYVFELYPLQRNDGYPMPQARLGFTIDKATIDKIKNLQDCKIELFEKPYGFLTKDPQGRFVELYTNG